MAKKVGICAVAQTTFERNKKDIRFQDMALDVLEALREQVEVKFARHVKGAAGVNMSISVSDDIFNARTISDNAMTDVLGAHFGCEEKVAQEGIQALYYGLAAIASGHNDMVLLMGSWPCPISILPERPAAGLSLAFGMRKKSGA